ncbi:MAG: hypothetical protein U0R52_05740 [Solirubrobacterales bacterium]
MQAIRRSGLPRTVVVAAAVAASMLALVAASAQAKVVKVTGESSTFTPSAQVTGFLANHGVSVSAIEPASIQDGKLTLPIVAGRVNTKNAHGVLAMKGGIELSKGERSVKIRHFVAVNTNRGAWLGAKVGKRRLVVARLTDRSKQVDGTSATVSANLRLSRPAAKLINRVAGAHVVSAGALLGSATATVTTG